MTLAAENVILSRGGARVLDRVSLALGPGEVVGLLGANGAGKSTLLGALAAELRGEGALRLDGEDLSAWRPRGWRAGAPCCRRNRGWASTWAWPRWWRWAPTLFRAAAAAVEALVDRTLALADATHLRARRYPELSGGEQQRVQFARADPVPRRRAPRARRATCCWTSRPPAWIPGIRASCCAWRRTWRATSAWACW